VPELPTPSARTVMFTQSHVLSKYIDAKRNRRRKAVERQKRLKVGLPAAVPLKHVSLDPEQREAIASTEAIGTARRKRLFVTRHFGWPISLGIHVFVAFLLTIYAVTEYIPEGVPVFLDFVEPIREPRDIRRRSPIKPANPPKSLQIQPKPTPQAAPRVIELPREVARFVTPEDNLSDVGAGPTAAGISIPEGLGNIQVEQGRAEIPTELGVKIDRDSSIAPEDSEIDISEDGLGDRAIDADVSVQVDQQPRVLRKTKPKYPEAARRAQKEGFVELEFTVGVDGKTTDIKVVKEEPKGFGFGRAAIESVKRWRFTPAKKGGENVPMRVKIPIRFTLEDD
jgi:TonB family protein